MRRINRAAVFAALLVFAGEAMAAENPVHWSLASVPQKPLHPGANFTAKLLARIDSGWHLYALDQEEGSPIPTEISLASPSFLTLSTVRPSKPIQLLDPNFNKRVGLYIEKAEFGLSVRVATTAPVGSQKAAVQMRYQCCNNTMCLPPRTATVNLELSIKAQ